MTNRLLGADNAEAGRVWAQLSQPRRKGTQGTPSLGQRMKANRQVEGHQELRPGAEDIALAPAILIPLGDLGQVPVITVLSFPICGTCG